MNFRFVSFTMSAVSDGHFHAEMAIRMHSRAHEEPQKLESIRWAGSSLDELQTRVVEASKQVFISLSEHDFWIPTFNLTTLNWDRSSKWIDFTKPTPARPFSTPYVPAEAVLSHENVDHVLATIVNSDEYSNQGVWYLMQFFQEIKHYGRIPALRKEG